MALLYLQFRDTVKLIIGELPFDKFVYLNSSHNNNYEVINDLFLIAIRSGNNRCFGF